MFLSKDELGNTGKRRLTRLVNSVDELFANISLIQFDEI